MAEEQAEEQAEEKSEEQYEALRYHPNLKEADGMYCFLDSTRACGPDCMAYLTEPAGPATSPLNEQQQHCLLLTRVEQLPRFIGGGISLLKKQQADKARVEAGSKSPPSPLGKTS